MGKRKSARKVAKKEKSVLDKTFACVFCNHEKTVSIKFDKENKIAHLICSACGVQWSTSTLALTEEIDVYSDWVDACEAANKQVVIESEEDEDF